MVEYGAGGNIVQESEPTPPPAPAAEAGEDASTAAAATTATGATAIAAAAPLPMTEGMSPTDPGPFGPTPIPFSPPSNSRRRRRAKGWSCPVCRQPYTSLLRITTSVPEPEDKEEEQRDAAGKQEATPAAETPARPGGIPGFLRSLSARTTATVAEPDLERGAATA
jgi:hypothetical protein